MPRGNPNWTKGKGGNPGGEWTKGKSANPGGRPQGVRSYLNKRYGREARKIVDALDKIAFNQLSKDQLPALRELLTRHSGQPPQSVDVTSGGQILPTITVIELPATQK